MVLLHKLSPVLHKIIRYDIRQGQMLSLHNEMASAFFLWGSGQCGSKLQVDIKIPSFEIKKFSMPSLASVNQEIYL